MRNTVFTLNLVTRQLDFTRFDGPPFINTFKTLAAFSMREDTQIKFIQARLNEVETEDNIWWAT